MLYSQRLGHNLSTFKITDKKNIDKKRWRYRGLKFSLIKFRKYCNGTTDMSKKSIIELHCLLSSFSS
jgi:hypothetical protein